MDIRRYIIGPALHVVGKAGSLTHSGMACGGTCIRRSLGSRGSELRRIAKATSESIRVAFLTYSYESTLSTLRYVTCQG